MKNAAKSKPVVAEMRRSWLIQRLERPRRHGGQLDGLLNAMAFGGGLHNGGLTAEGLALVGEIFSFDYMGAAEFEWGAVPKALQSIAAAHRSLTAGVVEIDLSEVPKPFLSKASTPAEGVAPVYWLAPGQWGDEVETRIRTWAREGHRARLMESTNLDRALRPADDYDRRCCGWLELDNGFLFFTDRTMWEQTCDLFGVVTRPGSNARSEADQ